MIVAWQPGKAQLGRFSGLTFYIIVVSLHYHEILKFVSLLCHCFAKLFKDMICPVVLAAFFA